MNNNKLFSRPINRHKSTYLLTMALQGNVLLYLTFSMNCPNKMQGHFWHQFRIQILILFHVVPFNLFSMAASITAYFNNSGCWITFTIKKNGWKRLKWRAKSKAPHQIGSENKIIPVPDPDKSAMSDIPAPPLRWVSIFRLFVSSGFQGCINPKISKIWRSVVSWKIGFRMICQRLRNFRWLLRKRTSRWGDWVEELQCK